MTENELRVQKEIVKILGYEVSGATSYEHFINKLEALIGYLILNDFQKLVSLLYKIDINEDHLRRLIKNRSEENTATLITRLIIERQSEKIKTRQQFNIPDSPEEKW